MEARKKVVTSFWVGNYGLGSPLTCIGECCNSRMFICSPITFDGKLKQVLCTHSYISIVFSQHRYPGIDREMIMLKKKRKGGRGRVWRNNGRGWFFWLLLSSLHCQVCICQLVASQAARLWGGWVFSSSFFNLFLIDKALARTVEQLSKSCLSGDFMMHFSSFS